jgi:hypothetical protein
VKYVLPELISQEIISGGIFSQELILAHRNTCIMCSCLLEEIWGNEPNLDILLRPFGFIVPKTLNDLAFQF